MSGSVRGVIIYWLVASWLKFIIIKFILLKSLRLVWLVLGWIIFGSKLSFTKWLNIFWNRIYGIDCNFIMWLIIIFFLSLFNYLLCIHLLDWITGIWYKGFSSNVKTTKLIILTVIAINNNWLRYSMRSQWPRLSKL